MSPYFNYIKNNRIFSVFVLCVSILMGMQDPWLQPDSSGYLEFSLMRGPLYPAFLWILNTISQNNFQVIVIAQTIIGVAAIIYFLRFLDHVHSLKSWQKFIAFVLLLTPYLGHTKIHTTILTEPLCYPLFLVLVVKLIDYVHKPEVFRKIFPSIILIILLSLVRKQFSFLLATYFVFFGIWLFKHKKLYLKEALTVIGAFVALIILERSYVFFKTGKFEETPFSITYISYPLYIATEEILTKPNYTNQEKAYISSVLSQRNEIKLGLHDDFTKYKFIFAPERKFEVVHDFFRYITHSKALKDAEIHENHHQFTKNLAFKMMKTNLMDYIYVYMKTVINGIGGYYNLAIVGLVMLFGICCVWIAPTKLSLLILMAPFLQFTNYSIVALFQPTLRRYTFYTDIVFTISILLIILFYFNNVVKFKNTGK